LKTNLPEFFKEGYISKRVDFSSMMMMITMRMRMRMMTI
jgi:hypothetical protein